MDFRVLGPLEVSHDGLTVPIRSGRPRKLLVALLLRLGDRVRSDALIDLLWPDDSPLNSTNSLQILVSYLRKALPAGPDGESCIETVDNGYRLRVPPSSVDAYRMEQAAAAAGAERDSNARLQVLDEGLSEWRGAPAPELDGAPFAEADIVRLQEVRMTLLEQRSEVLLDLGDPASAVVALQQLVAEHPLREKLTMLLMTALYRCGRQAEALEVYEKARRTLVEELGLDPGPALQATAEAVLRQSPHLAAVQDSATPETPRPLDVPSPGAEAWRPLDQLIGRSEEVERLSKLLVQRRLVTLTGPGGAGKTRLAAQLAADSSAENVWWADLAPATGSDSVLATIAHATGVPASTAPDVATFAAQLSGHSGLLVLDTCERVRTSVKPLVEALLRACPDVRILATSRQPVGAAIEMAWPVPPLSLPHPEATSVAEVAESAAVELFLERASSRRPDLVLSAQNASDIARVCLLLDGLPLAIELAAAHAPSLAPSEMVKVLQDRLRILVDDGRDERQSTLRATIAWSYDQLQDDEARFLDRLSVFIGAFPLDGALAVGSQGLQRDGLEILLTLARQSLVTTTGDRYRMLDTIRAFAAEKLGSDEERAAAQRRHVEWYLRILEEVGLSGDTNKVEGWRGELRDVLLDLRAALSWCFTSGELMLGARLLASLWWLWPREGVLEEADPWFHVALDATDVGSPLHAALLASSASYAVSRGDLDRALVHGQSAAERLEALGDRRGSARALLPVGIAFWAQGDYERAIHVQDRAIELFELVENGWGAALARVMRARTASDAASEDASEQLESAEIAARVTGDGHLLAAALVQRARAMVAAGQYVEGAAMAEESLVLNDLHGHREGAVGSLHTLGFALIGQGDFSSAARTFIRALHAALAMHHRGATSESLDGLALVAASEGRWLDSARLLARADLLRAESRMRRSTLSTALVGPAETNIRAELSGDEVLRVTGEAALLDLHLLRI